MKCCSPSTFADAAPVLQEELSFTGALTPDAAPRVDALRTARGAGLARRGHATAKVARRTL